MRLYFSEPPILGSSSKITIVDTSTHQVVETIDVSAKTSVKTIGSITGFNYYPVILSGREADIYPRNGVLSYHQTYEVTIDPGLFKGGTDTSADPGATAAWRFTTKSAAPAAGATKLIVAADGTGDFATVQGALDFIPDGNTMPRTVFVRRGTYTEIVAFAHKHAITLLGEDRKKTVLAYANNAKLNDGGGNPYGGATPNPSAEPIVGGHIYHRGVFLAHQVDDLVLTNLTLRNTTPHGGSQSEAIILNGTTEAHAVLRDVELYSFQDTLQINGQRLPSGTVTSRAMWTSCGEPDPVFLTAAMPARSGPTLAFTQNSRNHLAPITGSSTQPMHLRRCARGSPAIISPHRHRTLSPQQSGPDRRLQS